MSYPFPQDLQEIIAAKMSTGRYASEDDLLREAVRALGDDEANWQAIEEGLADYEAGDRGLPLAEAFETVKRSVGSNRS
jgi:Arc/MetJ-type ribon-helix-helix transcriptional regulator